MIQKLALSRSLSLADLGCQLQQVHGDSEASSPQNLRVKFLFQPADTTRKLGETLRKAPLGLLKRLLLPQRPQNPRAHGLLYYIKYFIIKHST